MKLLCFFENLFGTVDLNVSKCSKELLGELLTTKLSREAALDMSRPVCSEEIKLTMFGINWDKAPRPDGYIAKFFKKTWSVVGKDVVMAVKEFFQTRKMHPGFNSTIVTLVPKCPNPCSIRDFRPISCCSVIYKCITKIIANRLKKYMPQLVGNNQSAFIPGRSITDKIHMA